MVFSSGLPPDGTGDPLQNWRIWVAERNGTGWVEPFDVGPPVNFGETSADYPTLAANGNLYFFSGNRGGGLGAGDIWRSRFNDGNYYEPENLGGAVNSESWDIDPFISPDEQSSISYDDKMKALSSWGNGSEDIYWASTRILDALRGDS